MKTYIESQQTVRTVAIDVLGPKCPVTPAACLWRRPGLYRRRFSKFWMYEFCYSAYYSSVLFWNDVCTTIVMENFDVICMFFFKSADFAENLL